MQLLLVIDPEQESLGDVIETRLDASSGAWGVRLLDYLGRRTWLEQHIQSMQGVLSPADHDPKSKDGSRRPVPF